MFGVEMKCPLCNRDLFHHMIHDPGEYHCPAHGPFLVDEIELSPEFHEFKKRVHGIEWLTGAISRFVGEEERKRDVDTIKGLGYPDAEDILDEKGDIISDQLMRGKLSLLKVEVDRYAQAIGFEHTGAMIKANEDIVEKHQITIRSGSQYPALDLLGGSRDLIIHPFRNKKLEKKPEMLDDLLANTDGLSYLRDPLIINDENLLDPIYTNGLQAEELREKIIDRSGPRSNWSKLSSQLFGECLIDGAIRVIREIDRARQS